MIERIKQCFTRISTIRARAQTYQKKSSVLAQRTSKISEKFSDILELQKDQESSESLPSVKKNTPDLKKITEIFPLKINNLVENNNSESMTDVLSDNMKNVILQKLYAKNAQDPTVKKQIDEVKKYYENE